MFQYACRNCCTAANRCILSCSNFERLPKRVYEHYFGAGNLDQAAGGAGEACELRFHLQFSGSSHHKSVVLSSLKEEPAELSHKLYRKHNDIVDDIISSEMASYTGISAHAQTVGFL